MPQRASDPPHIEIIALARQISGASDEQLAAIFHRLRFEKRLSATVRGLNQMLLNPHHENVALLALRRL
jgi:hypothetical protein